MDYKTCKHCNETKQIEEFKSIYVWYCNKCQPEIEKIRKKKNSVNTVKYFQKNKISYNEYMKEYRKRPEVKQKTRDYYNKKYK